MALIIKLHLALHRFTVKFILRNFHHFQYIFFVHQIVTLILVKTVELVQKYPVEKPTNATVRMHSQAKTVQNQQPSRRVGTHPVSIVNFIFSLHFSHCKDIPRTQPVIPYDAITMIKCRVFPTKLKKANKMSIMCSFKTFNV